MEVAVYMSLDSLKADKSVFKRQVLCPGTFNVDSFVNNMKSIFGKSAIVSVLYV